MNRYKISDGQIEKAKKFLKGKRQTGPAWAVKFKNELKIVGRKLLFNDKEVVSLEKVDTVLRKEIYKKNLMRKKFLLKKLGTNVLVRH